jgi:hypothetical protein
MNLVVVHDQSPVVANIGYVRTTDAQIVYNMRRENISPPVTRNDMDAVLFLKYSPHIAPPFLSFDYFIAYT